jgi:DNA invertase Pin-like site-specific DNA recombinase
MLYAIKRLAPDPEIELFATTVLLLSEATHPGVQVHVDWPRFFGCTQAEIDQLVAERLAYFARERYRQQRGERIRAGLARRQAKGLAVGRQRGAADRKKRKRSGYFERWERERAR